MPGCQRYRWHFLALTGRSSTGLRRQSPALCKQSNVNLPTWPVKFQTPYFATDPILLPSHPHPLSYPVRSLCPSENDPVSPGPPLTGRESPYKAGCPRELPACAGQSGHRRCRSGSGRLGAVKPATGKPRLLWDPPPCLLGSLLTPLWSGCLLPPCPCSLLHLSHPGSYTSTALSWPYGGSSDRAPFCWVNE